VTTTEKNRNTATKAGFIGDSSFFEPQHATPCGGSKNSKIPCVYGQCCGVADFSTVRAWRKRKARGRHWTVKETAIGRSRVLLPKIRRRFRQNKPPDPVPLAGVAPDYRHLLTMVTSCYSVWE
jgi:hypothetical protein